MDIWVKLVDWGPKAQADVDTYVFLFQKQTGFSLHNWATSTNRQELLWEMTGLVSVQVLALPKSTEMLAVAQHIILGVRNLFSHKEGG